MCYDVYVDPTCELGAISQRPIIKTKFAMAPGVLLRSNLHQLRLRLPAEARLLEHAASLRRLVIRFALHIASFLGLFRVARHITRGGLRILCYHGFAIADEYKFRKTLFIREDLFRRRVAFLLGKGYEILPLSKALDALYSGRLPACAVVITMDDGWRGVYSVGLPIIKEFNIPVTVYVATDYLENPMPVYTVASSYLFWRTKSRFVTLPEDLGTFDLESQAEEAENTAQKYGASQSPGERLRFLKELAAALDVSFAEIERQQLFLVMDAQQLRCLDKAGVDIQLHSHRHDWPLHNRRAVESEITENRRFLEPLVSHPLDHFCYPSGVYGLHQAEWLAALGVKSATTIDPGLNFCDTPRFALRRIVDGGRVSDIEFAAEMTGFMEIVRWLRNRRPFSVFPWRWLRRRLEITRGAVR